MADRFLSSAGTGKNCALSMRFPDRSPALDKNRAPMGPEFFSSTGAGVCRKAPKAFSDSSSVLDKFQSAITYCAPKGITSSDKTRVDDSNSVPRSAERNSVTVTEVRVVRGRTAPITTLRFHSCPPGAKGSCNNYRT